MKSRSFSRWLPWLPVIVLLLAFALRVYKLGDQNVWWDEGFSVWVARHDLGTLTTIAAGDTHPPLYYWLLHPWMLAHRAERVCDPLSLADVRRDHGGAGVSPGTSADGRRRSSRSWLARWRRSCWRRAASTSGGRRKSACTAWRRCGRSLRRCALLMALAHADDALVGGLPADDDRRDVQPVPVRVRRGRAKCVHPVVVALATAEQVARDATSGVGLDRHHGRGGAGDVAVAGLHLAAHQELVGGVPVQPADVPATVLRRCSRSASRRSSSGTGRRTCSCLASSSPESSRGRQAAQDARRKHDSQASCILPPASCSSRLLGIFILLTLAARLVLPSAARGALPVAQRACVGAGAGGQHHGAVGMAQGRGRGGGRGDSGADAVGACRAITMAAICAMTFRR